MTDVVELRRDVVDARHAARVQYALAEGRPLDLVTRSRPSRIVHGLRGAIETEVVDGQAAGAPHGQARIVA